MKVALLTIWHEMNYGAELQAYATIRLLQQLGHHVQMIDIRLSDCHRPNINGRIGNFISSFGPARRKFDAFWKKHIPTTRRYTTVQELQIAPPEADVYIVGSDQVWNPELTGDFSKVFFLNFGSDSVRRVSYASSFGTSEWNAPSLTNDVKDLLNRFTAISSREQSGVDILRETFDQSATQVIDPTLLFPSYPELTGELRQKKTLVYYPLSDDYELMNYAASLSEKLGLELVNNKETTVVFGRFPWDRVGIEEWVRNIAEAKFVITRSFHGLIFSILYKKPFAIIAGRNNRGTRVKDLLNQLGLSDRYFDCVHACDVSHVWNRPIDYATVHSKLDVLREMAINFLKQSLA